MSLSLCRALVIRLVCVASTLAVFSTARAQTCHTPATIDSDGTHPYRPYVGAIVASYGSGDDAGNYQGLYAGFVYQHRWFGGEVRLPVYWLKRDDHPRAVGVGDMVVSVSGTALRLRRDKIALGVELPLMIPTGDADRELGMGHPMLMPAAWFTLEAQPFTLRAQAGYGRLLGDDAMDHTDHTHHGSPNRTPIVNPMNRSEFEHALSMSLGLGRVTRVHLGWMGSVPIADERGVVRQILAIGAAATVGPVSSSFELQRPVAGDPFTLRLVLQLTGTF
jgi:hypothetical protein